MTRASVAGRALDDDGQTPPHLRCDSGELLVADDREHLLGVDRGPYVSPLCS
jgi:hypothetical protein